MSEPTKVDPSRFFEFISRPGLVVVFMPFHGAHPFNHALPRFLPDVDELGLRFGRVSLIELFVEGGSAVMFLQEGLRACGVSKAFDFLPGYYLFDDGQLIAWDSGFPTSADLRTIVGASVLGAIAYAFTRNPTLIAKAFGFGAQQGAGSRLAALFAQAATQHRAAPRPRGAPRSARPPNPISELLDAYRLLGVDPEASDREVNAAWRKRQAELHPDRAADDPAEFERRSRISTGLNHARDVIRAHRAHTGSGATAASPAA